MYKISRGLDIPIAGAPRQEISTGPDISRVALLGEDYHGLKPGMAVEVGDRVKQGQVLFVDKRDERLCFTAPAAGVVVEINRGPRRVLQSVVVAREGKSAEAFPSHGAAKLASLEREQIVASLLRSGLWTALRTRPFSKLPLPDSRPAALFVTALDTNPHAPDPAVVLAERATDFETGLALLGRLTAGPLYLCTAPGAAIPGREHERVTLAEFAGPHPAGLVGTHMHLLMPAHARRTLWSIGYQDVADIGLFFRSGELPSTRVISLAGPAVREPRLMRTLPGACIDELSAAALTGETVRLISGSVLHGRCAAGPHAYLSRYTNQVSALDEGTRRVFQGWLRPGVELHSTTGAFASAWLPRRLLRYNTNLRGGARAMVPIGSYERVLPLDLEPVYLLRALIVGDTDRAVELGALELDEEDLALCTYVCPGKYNYGQILRDNLSQIEKELA